MLDNQKVVPKHYLTTQDIDVVLVSLGTPEELSTGAIRNFLRRFLSDQRVVEAPKLLWLPILYGIILPFRPAKLKHAYAEIWEQQGGSPLRIIADQQQQELQKVLDSSAALSGRQVSVHSVMLYGDENVEKFLLKRASLQRHTIILPLYPQYSATTTAAVYDQVFSAYQSLRFIPSHYVVNHYYAHPHYRKALSQSVEDFWELNQRGDYLLMSFHGIPQDCINNGDPYFEHCVTTADNLAQDLLLDDSQYAYSFQSRLGPKQWLQPYTDKQVEKLAQQGIETLDVVCPSFSSDCLETLEEIAIQANETFVQAGGKKLRLIPCLNTQRQHIELFKQLVLENI